MLEHRLGALEAHVKVLYEAVQQTAGELQTLRQEDTRRAAEHAAMLDSLNRLYRRVSARIGREVGAAPAEESTKAMIDRLRKKPWG